MEKNSRYDSTACGGGSGDSGGGGTVSGLGVAQGRGGCTRGKKEPGLRCELAEKRPPHQEAARANARGAVLLGELLEGLERLLSEVDVLNGEQTCAEAGQGAVVHDAGPGGGEHVGQVREGTRGEEHGVRVVLRIELANEERDEGVHREIAARGKEGEKKGFGASRCVSAGGAQGGPCAAREVLTTRDCLSRRALRIAQSRHRLRRRRDRKKAAPE